MKESVNRPIKQIADAINMVLALNPETLTYQKWTCKHCQSRQTMEQPNTLYTSGKCEACGQVSSIEECGFMLLAGFGISADAMKNLFQ